MGVWTQWLVCVVVVHHVRGCNVREVSEVVQRRFREELAAQCSSIGDKCYFDRECCKGLECQISTSRDGMGFSCQRAVLADPDRADMAFDTVDPEEKEPQSEDGDWMITKLKEGKVEEESHSSEDKNEEKYTTDVLAEIQSLQEKKKQKLLRENYELEKLFTEREEAELEQLRALREDAEIDDLRRLKELRLRRKIQLIRELKELRGLKAEEEFKAMNNKLKNVTDAENELLANQTGVIENNGDNLNYNATLDENIELSSTAPEIPDTETIPNKHKQGIHDVHRKRKHHHRKRKDPQKSDNLTSTIQ